MQTDSTRREIMRRVLRCFVAVFVLGVLTANANPADFKPDPKSVQRHGAGYRYPQAGWIVLHIEGEPYERGYQHGKLLAPEIAAFVRCYATVLSPKAPTEGWSLTRKLVGAVFLRRFEREYLEEMKGIADGAVAGGARFDNRPLDLVDIAAINLWPEIDTLGSALEATPTGLEGVRFPRETARLVPPEKGEHCSAFAATGPATADGKIVFGHITMFGLYPSNYYNVWLDLKPAKGYRVMMQTYPGGIQSGMDYYYNDSGLLVCETTIRQTRFDVNGMCLASRIRQALQYADNIDRAVAILSEGNNGLYTNEWLLGDIKTNEIAMFELGTHKTKLYRSSKNEWFGGTEGFYWGCNNTKDLDVRLETIASTDERPANMVFRPSDRDRVWMQLYAKHKGKIDAEFGKEAFTTPPIAAYHSLDAKFTTTALAKEMKTWALFGPPLGRSWQPTFEERQRYPEVQALVSNPWTILHGTPPDKQMSPGPVAVDLHADAPAPAATSGRRGRRGGAVAGTPAWHGTILPKTDADIWLAAAFADYEHIVSRRRSGPESENEGASANERDSLGLALFGFRSVYLAATRIVPDTPLAKTRTDVSQDAWYRIAAGKGTLLLHELRKTLGDKVFVEMMESFGHAHAGQPVTTAEFRAHAEKAAGKPLGWFFEPWLQQPGLMTLRLGKVTVAPKDKGFVVEGEIARDGPSARTSVEVALETKFGRTSKTISLDASTATFAIETQDKPERVIVDSNGTTPKTNGGVYSVLAFQSELERTLIVYGTADEAASNREAAEDLQRAIVRHGSNYTVPFKADREVTEAELREHHLVLIGRPDTNTIVARVQGSLPITFGSRSFVVGKDSYAHENSAVATAGENPLNRRYSVVVVAGLSPASTMRSVEQLLERGGQGEVLILPNGGRSRSVVVPAKELVRELHQ
jgi:hypothetical protein